MSGTLDGESALSVIPGVEGGNTAAGGLVVYGESQGGEGVHGVSHSGFAGVGGYNDNPQGGSGRRPNSAFNDRVAASVRRRNGRLAGAVACLICLAIGSPAFGELRVSGAEPINGGSLSSRNPTTIRVWITAHTTAPGKLQVWLEEYPSNSGCGGNVHRTNGGGYFQVSSGITDRSFTVTWPGHGYSAGFLKPSARLLDSGETAVSDICLRFGP